MKFIFGFLIFLISNPIYAQIDSSDNYIRLLGSAEYPSRMEKGHRAEDTGGKIKVDLSSLILPDTSKPISFRWYSENQLIPNAVSQELITTDYQEYTDSANIYVEVEYTDQFGSPASGRSSNFNYSNWRIRTGGENRTLIGDNPTPFWETYSYNNDSSNKDENGEMLTDSDIHSISPILGDSIGVSPIEGEYIIRIHADGSNYGSDEPNSFSKRAELGNRDWNNRIRKGSEVFYSTYFYLPSDYWDNVTKYSIVFFQHKQYVGGSPNFEIRLSNNGDYGMYIRSEYHLEDCTKSEACQIATMLPNNWHKLNIHMKPEFNGEGFMDVYLDGKTIYSYSGTNLKNESSYDPDKHDSFIKIGMYTEIRDERVIYLDNLEMSNHLNQEISNWILVDDSNVSNESESVLPEQYVLSQNYPNPFNPSTKIQYSLPEATMVTLEVFNSVGQKVMELVNGQKSAGYHTATFDASGLSSGVYLYKLTTPSFTETKKMLLIK